MCSNISASMIPLSLIEALNSPQHLPENSPDYSNMTYNSPLPITPKLMDKQNEPIRNWKLIFASFAPTTPHPGHSSYLPQNFIIILPHIVPPRNLRSPSFMALNTDPTHLLVKPSSRPLKTVFPLWMKHDEKPLLLMILHKISWPNDLPDNSFHGKSATQYG